jgi:DNA mismatch repair protein MutH
MSILWVSLETYRSIPIELRAHYGIDLRAPSERALNREIQRDHEEEAEAAGVLVRDLLGR